MTFTDFMVNTLTDNDDVTSAIVIYRKDDGTIGYRAFNQDVASSMGLLRFAALSVENDLIREWREDS